MIKNQSRAIALALLGFLLPGLHKFYLKQRGWAIAYLVLYPTHIPQVASVLEGLWYVWLGQKRFEQRFNPGIAHLQADPYVPLRTLEDLQLAAHLGLTIDVNRATPKDWQRLPQLSSEQASLLTQLTQAGVQFNSLDDMAAGLGVTPTTLQPIAPVLRFYYYESLEATAASAVTQDPGTDDALQNAMRDTENGLPLNPNHATFAELMTIPSMEDAIAQKIVTERQTEPYTNLVDFKERLSLTANSIYELMYYLKF